MSKYIVKTETDFDDNEYEAIYKIDGEQTWSIPKDEANSDYQAYLASLKK